MPKKDALVSLESPIPRSKVECWSNELTWFGAIAREKMKGWLSWILEMTSYYPFSVSQNGMIFITRLIRSDSKEFLGPYVRKLPRSAFEIKKLNFKNQLIITCDADKHSFKIKIKEVLPSGFDNYEKLHFPTYIFAVCINQKIISNIFHSAFCEEERRRRRKTLVRIPHSANSWEELTFAMLLLLWWLFTSLQ